MKIMKFGGSSLATVDGIRHVVAIIEAACRANRVAVVVSAFGGATETLIQMANQAAGGKKHYLKELEGFEASHRALADALVPADKSARPQLDAYMANLRDTLQGLYLIRELSPRSMDLVMSFGERLSAMIVSRSLVAHGIEAESVEASSLIKTDDRFGNAVVDYAVTNRRIKAHFCDRAALQVVTGFIASTEDGEITTLGRSGSDHTATILAAALDCDCVEIWTDVSGVMTADPRMVPDAFPITDMTYAEAMEMSHFGAKVLHPKSIQPVLEKGIPLIVKNTFEPAFAGSVIRGSVAPNPFMIRGMSSIGAVSLLRVEGSGMPETTGIAGRLFGSLARGNINIILITQGSSEHSICLAVSPADAQRAKKLIDEEFAREIYARQIDEPVIEDGLSVVAVVGENMRGVPGIAARIFNTLAKEGVNVVAIVQGSSELNVSIVVSQRDEATALNAIHEAFFTPVKRTVHLYLVGTGQVASALLHQLRQQAGYLIAERGLEIKLNGIANSKKMHFSERGIDLGNCHAVLEESDSAMDMQVFVDRVRAFNFKNSVFVDCTASDAVAASYEDVLKSRVSVVTPNKRANSGTTYAQYLSLKQCARKNGVAFHYETNVGASLPILRTVQDLVLSGDKILKIEAVVSGTLSYIFNVWDAEKKFSEVVREAKEKGFTEPDPRDDLNGMDVARKLLILAREAGYDLEPEEITLQNILPESCRQAESVDAFFTALERADAHFDRLKAAAEQEGKVLRYIASFANGRADVALQAVDSSHPFYGLTGAENIIALTTNRYVENPLVIRGPGAGADLTAAGVFAGILQTLN